MPCFHPLDAVRIPASPRGKVSIVFSGLDVYAPSWRIKLPCGRCSGCRFERARQWSVRIMHEASRHPVSCFVTLTYDNDSLPDPPTLVPRDMTLFLKRLRRWHDRQCLKLGVEFKPLAYYYCGEYGDETNRPHYHLCLFGCDFASEKQSIQNASGSDGLWSAPSLVSLWSHGHVSIGQLTADSAAYVARYCMKKVNGDLAHEHYTRLDPMTGEWYQLYPEFARMSLRPAIGKKWFEQFASDVYPNDLVVTNGRPAKPPRYYDQQLAKRHGFVYNEVKLARELAALEQAADNRPARLLVKEQVHKAAISHSKRGYL